VKSNPSKDSEFESKYLTLAIVLKSCILLSHRLFDVLHF